MNLKIISQSIFLLANAQLSKVGCFFFFKMLGFGNLVKSVSFTWITFDAVRVLNGKTSGY